MGSGEISPGGKLTYTLPNLEEHDNKAYIQSPIGRFNKGLVYDGIKKRHTIEWPAYLWDHTNNKSSEIIQYNDHISSYAEKNLVGYKYYEKYNMIPLFPFGFGLSYTNYHIIPCFTYCVSHASCKIDVLVKSTHK